MAERIDDRIDDLRRDIGKPYPGDLIGFETSGPFAWFIRLGQRLARVENYDITHIGVVVVVRSDGGDASIVQSVRRVNKVALSSYGTTPYVVIPFPGADNERAGVVRFAMSCLGRKYGILSVLSRAWNTVTPSFIQFGCQRAGDMDCSALGARAFEHGGVRLQGVDPFQYEPGQLADEFGVTV